MLTEIKMTKIQLKILSFFLGIPIGFGIGALISCLLFVETDFGTEYRFDKLSWFGDLFFDGYHYDSNGYYYILILVLGIFTALKLLKFIIKPVD